MNFYINLSVWARSFWIFPTNFGGVVETSFYMSIGTVWEKPLFWRACLLFIILGHWVEICSPFSANFSEGLSKLHSTCPYEKYEEKQFFEERMYILSFWDLEQKIFGLVLKKRSQDLSKLHFTSPEEWFEERQSSEKFSFVLLFLHIEQKLFWLSFRKKLGGYAKTVFYLPIGSFRKNIFFTNLCFPNFFGPWTKTFQPIFRKLFGGVVKTAFYVSRGTVGGKLNFLKKVYFLFIFAHWDEDFSPFVGKISVVPSNFHSMSP